MPVCNKLTLKASLPSPASFITTLPLFILCGTYLKHSQIVSSHRFYQLKG